uniref:Uncharacterized protein n=1 Tax=Pyxicephalus adspersus TaxID=30357 RepID=A0AAV3B164_PYXAD|nr:TPA: hypothetical protein GDO54_006394 [Pyxicephalus adspersus]
MADYTMKNPFFRLENGLLYTLKICNITKRYFQGHNGFGIKCDSRCSVLILSQNITAEVFQGLLEAFTNIEVMCTGPPYIPQCNV